MLRPSIKAVLPKTVCFWVCFFLIYKWLWEIFDRYDDVEVEINVL